MNKSLLQRIPQNKRPFIMAHRGNRVKFPENTLPAFIQAVEDKADIIETDLHLCADGEFMCIHDSTVDRTTNGEGLVRQKSLKELKLLSILDSHSNVTNLKIPTLTEMTQVIPEGVALALELKTDRFLEPDTCSMLAKLLESNHILDRTICLSFSMERIRSVKKEIPSMPIGWITMSRLLPDKDVDLIGAFWPVMFINPWYVRMAHRQKMLVCPLDPTPEPRLKQYMKMDCDAVLSDDAGKTRIYLDKIR